MSTTLEECPDEELIRRYSYRPRHIDESMIRIQSPPQLSSVSSSFNTSNSENFSLLSIEVFVIILNELDFLSLSRFLCTCHRNKAAVESFRPYRDLMRYCPEVLKALGQTRLLSTRPALSFFEALSERRCVSCGDFGAFLFLPTCERCCYECLFYNQSLWVTTLPLAMKAFDLSPADISCLPIMRAIPGSYYVFAPTKIQMPIKLVSIKAAMKLAISNCGSLLSSGYEDSDRPNALATRLYTEWNACRWIRNASLEPYKHSPIFFPWSGARELDEFCGVASILFPYSTPEGCYEYGYWCRGCRETSDLCGRRGLDEESAASLVPPGLDPQIVLERLKYRAWSKVAFLKHARKCYGVQILQASENS